MHSSRSNLSLSEKDNKKAVLERIQNVENCFGDLCTELSKFTKKKARLRDKYDELGRLFKLIADNDEFNETTSDGLMNYSKAMTLLGDVKDIEVQRLQTKIVRDLAGYESTCKNMREGVKHAMVMRDKEQARKQQLEQLKQRTQRKNSEAAGDNEISTSKNQPKKSNYDLEDILLKFEQQKLHDIQKFLTEFTLIQMKEHAKCIEILTAAYQDISAIDVEKDLQEFNTNFLMNEDKSLEHRSRSQSTGALSSLFSNSNSQQSQQLKSNRKPLSNSTYSLDTSDKDIGGNGGKNSKGRNTKEEKHSDTTTETTEDEDDMSSSEESDQSSDNEVDGQHPKNPRRDDVEEDDEDVVMANNPKTNKSRTNKGKDNKDPPEGQLKLVAKASSAPVPHLTVVVECEP